METLTTTPRRKRFEKREPQTGLILTEADLVVLWALHVHRGPLPSPYLRGFRYWYCKDRTGNTKRLAALYDNGYLTRPKWQAFNNDDRVYDASMFIVYDLTEKGIRTLKAAGMWSAYSPFPPDAGKHQMLTACITASIHLMAHRNGIHFIPQYEVLERAQTKLRFPVTYADPFTDSPVTKTLIPDAFFRLQYTNGGYRSYFVEADRDTEGNATTDHNRKGFLRSLLMYRQLFSERQHHELLKISGPAQVLNVNTSLTRMHNLIELTAEQSLQGKNTAQLFQMIAGITPIFRPPTVAEHLFTGGWQCAGAEDFYINKA